MRESFDVAQGSAVFTARRLSGLAPRAHSVWPAPLGEEA
jgi:hypothetical protein